MKLLNQVVIAAACASLAAPPALAAGNFIVWQGVAVVLTATAQCSAGTTERTKIAKGTVLTSVVRPAGLGDNGTDSRILFGHDGLSLFALDLAGGLTITGTGNDTADGVTTSGVPQSNVSGTYSAFALTPAAPTATTPFLKLTGTVNNFMFVSGCTVKFQAGYVLRTA